MYLDKSILRTQRDRSNDEQCVTASVFRMHLTHEAARHQHDYTPDDLKSGS